MGLAVVDVQIERPALAEKPTHLQETRLEEAEVVVELVRVRGLGEHRGGIAAALKTGAIAVRGGHGRKRPAALHPARVERGIEVGDLEDPVVELRQELEVVSEQDEVLRRPHERPA